MPSTAQTPPSFAHIHRTNITKSSTTVPTCVLSRLVYSCNICTQELLRPVEFSVAIVASEFAVLKAWWVGGGEDALWRWFCRKIPERVEC